ncbi:hypothetical protein SprV_0100219900 [Sparganum proliferum]
MLAETADCILEYYQQFVTVSGTSRILAASTSPTIQDVVNSLDDLILEFSQLRASRVSHHRSSSITRRQRSLTAVTGPSTPGDLWCYHLTSGSNVHYCQSSCYSLQVTPDGKFTRQLVEAKNLVGPTSPSLLPYNLPRVSVIISSRKLVLPSV